MSFVGIDIGSANVRVCCQEPWDPQQQQVWELPISISNSGDRVTQSSKEIITAIWALLKKSSSPVSRIAVSATCSMVVMERKVVDGRKCLVPFDLGVGDSNIIMWMDGQATKQTMEINREKKLKKVVDRLGGKVVPELGVAKLRWLSQKYPQEDLVCFELYDWVSYVFLVGMEDDVVRDTEYVEESYAMDGSIKGWSRSLLDELGVGRNINIGTSESILGAMPQQRSPMGYPLGNMNDLIQKYTNWTSGSTVVAHGCIDSYAGWLAMEDPSIESKGTISKGNLSMVAGTSTCFILAVQSKTEPPMVPGIWGPFNNILNNPDLYVYEFGQPATGKLFEKLFASFSNIIGNHNAFEWLETKTKELESTHGVSINELIKFYFYSGDVFGNRSPYNSFEMSEMVIDGYNASEQKLTRIIDSTSEMSLIIKYNLTLEFLAFQTKQLLSMVTIPVNEIIICGSQSANTRFLQLLSNVTGIPVTKHATDATQLGARGSAIISKLQGVKNVDSAKVPGTTIYPNECDKKLLATKVDILADMARIQMKYREMVRDI
jgi:ribulose kinase